MGDGVTMIVVYDGYPARVVVGDKHLALIDMQGPRPTVLLTEADVSAMLAGWLFTAGMRDALDQARAAAVPRAPAE